MIRPIYQTIASRDNITHDEAITLVREGRYWYDNHMDPASVTWDEVVDFIQDEFGLEPDYLDDFVTNDLYKSKD